MKNKSVVYSTSEIAKMFNVHPNTIRFYEKINFITKPKRLANGYRIFTNLHVLECQLIKTALKTELLQNGLRDKAIEIITLCSSELFDEAIKANDSYQVMLFREIDNAKKAIDDVSLLINKNKISNKTYKRSEVAKILNITTETLRTWERNGLVEINKKENGYLIYTDDDLKIFNIIKTLRLANYSQQAILRLLTKANLHEITNQDVEMLLNTPNENEDIISVCDHLIESLNEAYNDSIKINEILIEIKTLH